MEWKSRMMTAWQVFCLAVSLIASPVSADRKDDIQANMEIAAKSYIFVLKNNSNPDKEAPRLVNVAGGQLRHIYRHSVRGFSAMMSAQAAENIARNNPNIDYYEPNAVVWLAKPDGRGKPPKGDSGDQSQVIPWGVTRIGGHKDGTGYHAWVIDTGIDSNHADLNVGSGANFVLRGKNTTNDGNGHGTHVAGTIAALDNSIDVVGVAAGATVHPIRVLDNSGSGTLDGVIAGIDYVAANASAGDCANVSLGASGHFQSLHDAVVNAASQGIWFSIAAGNDSQHASNFEPADVEHPYVYTVSAIDQNDQLASFSNFGTPPVDWAAPGVGIESTKAGGGTVVLNGTSMAAPHVCGIALIQGVPNSAGSVSGAPIAHY